MVGKVLFSFVLLAPGILPADLPSHSYRNRRPFEAGCSTTRTKACFLDRGGSGLGTLPGTATAGIIVIGAAAAPDVTEPAAEGGYEDDIPAAAAAGAKNSWKVTGSALRITSTKIAIEQSDYAGSFMCTYSLKFDEE